MSDPTASSQKRTTGPLEWDGERALPPPAIYLERRRKPTTGSKTGVRSRFKPSRAPGFLVPSTHPAFTLQHRNRSPITAQPPTSNTPLCFLRNPPRCAAYPTHRPQNRRKHCAPAFACAAPQALRIFSSGSAFICAAPVAPRPPVPSSSSHSGGRGCCRRCLCRCSSCTASVAGRLPLR